ncbi:MAG: radical SAM protein [Ruminiclostridium sp.]|nr:radical SAM protein [Ruminiclostridium sp.]
MVCGYCPRKCNTDRQLSAGFCGMGELPVIARAFLHHWEEPCISGSRGSGTVFFSGCNLKCVYCQNYRISHENYGRAISIERLSEVFLKLQQKGAHNINLVTPSHFVKQICASLDCSRDLKIPIVYNSNGYDSLKSLNIMEGTVNIYLPDLKYYSSMVSLKYSGAEDYFRTAAAALREMYRQTGPAIFDEEGIMQRGMIIRHLILPGYSGESVKLLEWVRANIPEDVHLSLMSQYTPYHKAYLHPELNRRITAWEYEKVLGKFYKLGFKNGYIQERESASEEYIPDFNLGDMDF